MPAKLHIRIATGFIFLLALLGAADYFAPANHPIKDYIRGTFTETIGIIVTLIFVELIFSRYEARESMHEEIEAIKRADKVLTTYTNKYKIYATQVTTPLDRRDQNTYNVIPDDFNFNDMRDLFFQSLIMFDGQESVVLLCVKSQLEIKKCVEDILHNISFKNVPKLSDLFVEYLDAVGGIDLYEGIRFHTTVGMGDGKKLQDFIAGMIKDHSGPVEYKQGNIINSYIALYNSIKYHQSFFRRYESVLATIKSTET